MEPLAVTDRTDLRSETDRTVDADLPLLERIANGDEVAFERFVRRHERKMLGLCGRMLGDPEQARDAVQEVFLKVWRKARRFRPRGKVTTWLYRIAVNHCLNVLRRRKVVRMLPFSSPDAEDPVSTREPADPAPGPEADLDSKRRWLRTRRAIDRLPENQRSVLLLAKFEGLSYREIADVLGVTPGAVESRLFRAMRNLESAVLGEGADR